MRYAISDSNMALILGMASNYSLYFEVAVSLQKTRNSVIIILEQPISEPMMLPKLFSYPSLPSMPCRFASSDFSYQFLCLITVAIDAKVPTHAPLGQSCGQIPTTPSRLYLRRLSTSNLPLPPPPKHLQIVNILNSHDSTSSILNRPPSIPRTINRYSIRLLFLSQSISKQSTVNMFSLKSVGAVALLLTFVAAQTNHTVNIAGLAPDLKGKLYLPGPYLEREKIECWLILPSLQPPGAAVNTTPVGPFVMATNRATFATLYV